MKNRWSFSIIASLGLFVLAPQAQAKITKQDDNGFLVTHIAELEAAPAQIWQRLIKPSGWWDSAYSWSGSSDSLYLEEKAGGCFCEKLPASSGAGTVEHMRVIHISDGKVLRMQGGLGPLQSEAVIGTFTAAIAPTPEKEGFSRVSFTYIVGGYMRFPMEDMASNIDRVIGTQFTSLVKPFMPEEKKEDSFELDLEGLKDRADELAPLPNPSPQEKGR